MLADHFEHRLSVRRITRERTHHARFFSAHGISVTAHDRSQRSSPCATFVAVISQAFEHEKRAQIRETQSQRTVVVRVLGDLLRRIARKIDRESLERR